MRKSFLWRVLWRRIFVFAQSTRTYHTLYGCYDTVLVLQLIIPINDISGASGFSDQRLETAKVYSLKLQSANVFRNCAKLEGRT